MRATNPRGRWPQTPKTPCQKPCKASGCVWSQPLAPAAVAAWCWHLASGSCVVTTAGSNPIRISCLMMEPGSLRHGKIKALRTLSSCLPAFSLGKVSVFRASHLPVTCSGKEKAIPGSSCGTSRVGRMAGCGVTQGLIPIQKLSSWLSLGPTNYLSPTFSQWCATELKIWTEHCHSCSSVRSTFRDLELLATMSNSPGCSNLISPVRKLRPHKEGKSWA